MLRTKAALHYALEVPAESEAVVRLRLRDSATPSALTGFSHNFDALFASVAQARKVPLVPFFFEGFGERNDMFQSDRIHPSVAAQPQLLDNVWSSLEPLLDKVR